MSSTPEGYVRRMKGDADPRFVRPLRIESIRPLAPAGAAPSRKADDVKAPQGTQRNRPDQNNAVQGQPIAPKGTTRDVPERGTPAVNSLMSFTTLPPPPAPLKRATKSDGDRRAVLLPEIASIISVSLGAAEVLNWATIAWRLRREPATVEEIADALGISFMRAFDLRDELVNAGMIEAVRIGTLGRVAYRPAWKLAEASAAVTVQKSDAPRAPSAGLLSLQSKIGLRRQ